MTRDYHFAMIDAYTDALNRAMKEKNAANAHKPPLSEESDSALFLGADNEHREINHEVFWGDRFQTNWWHAMLEIADYNLYRAEEVRRLGAFTQCQHTKSDSRRKVLRSLLRIAGDFPRSFARTTRRPLRRSRRSERSCTTRDERCG